ncbi:hypothetical protein O1M54_08020 [Streptomyces diastatochromogenes]|nr:hypothetical protein [Streptomyces diastatochromogenes]
MTGIGVGPVGQGMNQQVVDLGGGVVQGAVPRSARHMITAPSTAAMTKAASLLLRPSGRPLRRNTPASASRQRAKTSAAERASCGASSLVSTATATIGQPDRKSLCTSRSRHRAKNASIASVTSSARVAASMRSAM